MSARHPYITNRLYTTYGIRNHPLRAADMMLGVFMLVFMVVLQDDGIVPFVDGVTPDFQLEVFRNQVGGGWRRREGSGGGRGGRERHDVKKSRI